jgi:hypothetical protein
MERTVRGRPRRRGTQPAARHATGGVAPLQQIAVPAQDRVRPHQ